MLWNPHQMEYEAFRKGQQDSTKVAVKPSAQIHQESSLLSWLPFGGSPNVDSTLESKSSTTTTRPPRRPAHFRPYRTPWDSFISFPLPLEKKGVSSKPKTGLHKIRIPKTKNKAKPRKYNPLCFFSALPCASSRKNVYYVPKIDHDDQEAK